MSSTPATSAAVEPSIREFRFADPEALAEALAASVADSLRQALAPPPASPRKEPVSLVVSGGSTPRPFFERLRHQPLPWREVAVTLADERWVPIDHPESNERLVRETLLRDEARWARWVGLKSTDEAPTDAVAACEERISPLRPFTVTILGMGTDGHTASLFPGDPTLEEAGPDRTCAAVPAADGRRPRLTLTLPALLESRRLILHFTGEEKWQLYQESRRESKASPRLPVGALLHGATALDIFWAP